MKAVFLNLDDKYKKTIEENLPDLSVCFIDGDIEDNLDTISDAEIVSIFVGKEVTKEILQKLKNVKYISTRSTGFDHIDTAVASNMGIMVSNVPEYGSKTVAEFTFGLILSISRKVHGAYDRLRESGDTDVEDFEGFDLCGKTLGVIGTGNIGKNVIKIAKGFSMNVLAFDIKPDQEFARDMEFQYGDIEQVVKESDIVTLHVPYIQATHHLINKSLLSNFKDGSYLINTSRGEVVDTVALIDSLKSGKLAGAGLDVIEGEELVGDELKLLLDGTNDVDRFQEILRAHALIDMPNVIVTPHIAFNTTEAKRAIIDTTISNIKSFVSGNPTNIVNN